MQDHVPDYHLCFMSRAIIGHARSKLDRCYVSQFPPFGFGAFVHTCVYMCVCVCVLNAGIQSKHVSSKLGQDYNVFHGVEFYMMPPYFV